MFPEVVKYTPVVGMETKIPNILAITAHGERHSHIWRDTLMIGRDTRGQVGLCPIDGTSL